MNNVTRFWWVRHAPVPTVVGTIYGANDVPCDTSDRDSFEALAAVLPAEAVWLTSHLSRTHKTAGAIRDAGLAFPEPIVEENLGEQSFGAWQGYTWDEMEAKDGEVYHTFWADPARSRPPEGESFQDQIHRVGKVIDRYVDTHGGQDIVAVAHGGTIRAAIAHAMELAPEGGMAFTVGTLSITVLEHIPGGLLRGKAGNWRVVRINSNPHSMTQGVKGGH